MAKLDFLTPKKKTCVFSVVLHASVFLCDSNVESPAENQLCRTLQGELGAAEWRGCRSARGQDRAVGRLWKVLEVCAVLGLLLEGCQGRMRGSGECADVATGCGGCSHWCGETISCAFLIELIDCATMALTDRQKDWWLRTVPSLFMANASVCTI